MESATARASGEVLRFADLEAGNRVRIVQRVRVGARLWETSLEGTVISTRRRRHGLHVNRAADDKAFSDVIVLRRGESGELTTVAVDEHTFIARIDG